MALDIKALMVLGSLETAQAGGDSAIAARFNVYAIRRVAKCQLDLGPLQQLIHMLRVAAVTAFDAVLTQQPDFARFRHCFIRRPRDCIRIGQSRSQVACDSLLLR